MSTDSLTTLEYFNRLYEPARDHARSKDGVWRQMEAAFLGESDYPEPAGDESWRSQVFHKYGYQQVHTLAAEMNPEADPSFSFDADNPEADDFSELMESVVNKQLWDDDYFIKRVLGVMTAAVYGGQPFKVVWDYSCTWVETTHPVFGKMREKVVLRDQASMVPVNPRDFMCDPSATNMRNARFAFHRMRIPFEELEAAKRDAKGTPLYKNLSAVKASLTGGDSDERDRDLDHDYDGARVEEQMKGVEVVEMWTPDRVVTRAGGSVIIRDEPNTVCPGMLPFEMVTLFPSLNDVWGQPVMWLLRDVQEMLWTLDNAWMDALKLKLNPPVAHDAAAEEEMSAPFKPGGRYSVDDPNGGVQVWDVTGIDALAGVEAIRSVREQAEFTTGITREVAGQSSANSATEAAINQQQAKGRIGLMLKVMDFSLAKVVERMIRLNQRFLDLSKPIKIAGAEKGKNWVHIRPSQMAGQWSVRPRATSERVAKEIKRQNILDALSTLMPIHGTSLPDGSAVSLGPLLEELLETFGMPRKAGLTTADAMREEQKKDMIAQAQAEAEVAQMFGAGEGEEDPLADFQKKLFQSINYKDLPDPAQAAMLESVGLPTQGVEDDNRNPTRPNAGNVNPISRGLKSFNEVAG